jgi:hypothetical protein
MNPTDKANSAALAYSKDHSLRVTSLRIVNAFLAGNSFGRDEMLSEILELLRGFKDQRNSLRIPAECIADWLEETVKEKP